jgi:TetR/AcrR family transcriptional repressor of nem operon
MAMDTVLDVSYKQTPNFMVRPGQGRIQRVKKSKAETAETRRRIVRTAAAAFRKNGIHATGLAELMAAAGLTHGAFYRHFASKDQLVAEACAESMSMVEDVTTSAEHCSRKRAQAIVDDYLSLAHRDDKLTGCSFAALGSELARARIDARTAASDGFVALVDIIAKQFDQEAPEIAKSRAIVTVSAMIGAITMARITTDPALSDAILTETKKRLSDI